MVNFMDQSLKTTFMCTTTKNWFLLYMSLIKLHVTSLITIFFYLTAYIIQTIEFEHLEFGAIS